MSIRKHLTCERGALQRMDDFRPVTMAQELHKTENVRFDTSDRNQEYLLKAEIGVTFWANHAQLESARRIAERALVAVLYGDMFAQIAELRLALSDGDKRKAFEVVDRMQRIIQAED